MPHLSRCCSLLDSRSHTVNILITTHTAHQTLSEGLVQHLADRSLSYYLFDEATPQSLNARATCIQWCDLFVLVVSRAYQATFSCMAALNFAKDLRKPIVAILAEPTFRPSGALGAISASSIRSIVLSDETSIDVAIAEIVDSARNGVKNNDTPDRISNISLTLDDPDTSSDLKENGSRCTVLICTADDGADVGQLIFESLCKTQASVAIENLSKLNGHSSVAHYSVFVPILSPQFEQMSLGRSVIEQASRLGKPIVPVIAVRKWRPKGWLGLAIAGRIFFRIFDRETAYKPFYDSHPLNDLRMEIEVRHVL